MLFDLQLPLQILNLDGEGLNFFLVLVDLDLVLLLPEREPVLADVALQHEERSLHFPVRLVDDSVEQLKQFELLQDGLLRVLLLEVSLGQSLQVPALDRALLPLSHGFVLGAEVHFLELVLVSLLLLKECLDLSHERVSCWHRP